LAPNGPLSLTNVFRDPDIPRGMPTRDSRDRIARTIPGLVLHLAQTRRMYGSTTWCGFQLALTGVVVLSDLLVHLFMADHDMESR